MTAVEVNAKDVLPMLAEAPVTIRRASARALNRSIGAARTLMVRSVARDMGLRSSDIRERVRLEQASPDRLTAALHTGTVRLPLKAFNAKGPYPSLGKGRGVTYRIGQGTRRRETAFLARMASGHEGVFTRVGAARLPIRELFGPSIGRVFLRYAKVAKARAVQMFNSTMIAELKFRMGKR